MNEFDPKAKFQASSEVLQSLFENGKSPLSGQFLRWKLWARWPEIAGPTLAGVAEPVGYQRGVLWVWVKSSSWMQQLIFMREEIRDTIHKKMGVEFVKMIRFTLDRREVPTEAGEQEDIRQVLGRLTSSED